MRAPALLLCLSTAALAGCGPLPRDPAHTLERARGGVLHVGVSHDPPYVVLDGGTPRGSDVERAQAIARAVGARIDWVSGGHEGLMTRLADRQLQLVVGGVEATSPWTAEVGLTRPYDARDAWGRTVHRVMAVPPGENAWLMQVDAVLDPPHTTAGMR